MVEKILDVLQDRAEITANLLDIVLAGPSGAGYEANRMMRRGPRSFKNNWADMYRKRRVFQSTLTRLRQQGFIVHRERGGKKRWGITKTGFEKLRLLEKKKKDPFSSAHVCYDGKREPGIVIITFDVPEKEKRKRQWLRECLRLLQFRKLQKSVWTGTQGVPEDFVYALRERKMLDYVHILAVSKKGTAEELV